MGNSHYESQIIIGNFSKTNEILNLKFDKIDRRSGKICSELEFEAFEHFLIKNLANSFYREILSRLIQNTCLLFEFFFKILSKIFKILT